MSTISDELVERVGRLIDERYRYLPVQSELLVRDVLEAAGVEGLVEAAFKEGHNCGRGTDLMKSADEDWRESHSRAALEQGR